MKHVIEKLLIAVFVVALLNVEVVSAAGVGYFTTYSCINSNISNGTYSAQQGMCIDRANSDAYFIRRNNNTGEGQLVVCNFKKNNQPVYVVKSQAGEVASKIFGHGNDIAIVPTSDAARINLYVVTNTEGPYKNKILKLTVSRTNNDRAKYKYNISGIYNVGQTAYGITYSPGYQKFIIKVSKTKFFIGTFGVNNTFNKSGEFSINLNSVVMNGKNVNCSDYTGQGITFYKGILYVPMLNSANVKKSVILCYKLNANLANFPILNNKQDRSFQITGGNKFEIEDVDLCGGILYFNTNCDGRSDLLGKINGYVAAD